MENFADKLLGRVDKKVPLVVGIDPNFALMPKTFVPSHRSQNTIRDALIIFSKRVIDCCCDKVPCVKFQSAYFEAFGSIGSIALSESVRYAKQNSLLVILDVKRGDIGSTAAAYADAYLGQGGDVKSLKEEALFEYTSDLECDAITVNPFLGEDTLLPFIERAKKNGKGVFILVKTTNSGSHFIQDLKIELEGEIKPLYEHIAKSVAVLGSDSVGKRGFSSVGAVVGATYPEEAKALRLKMPQSIFLVPGIGSQGGDIQLINDLFIKKEQGAHDGALISVSRDITYPAEEAIEKLGYEEAVKEQVEHYCRLIRSSLQNNSNSR
jgi:orotidine-5'-phosphate decarboxylase